MKHFIPADDLILYIAIANTVNRHQGLVAGVTGRLVTAPHTDEVMKLDRLAGPWIIAGLQDKPSGCWTSEELVGITGLQDKAFSVLAVQLQRG